MAAQTKDVTIDHIGAQGDGVAVSADGQKLFVPFTVPGDLVRVRIVAGGGQDGSAERGPHRRGRKRRGKQRGGRRSINPDAATKTEGLRCELVEILTPGGDRAIPVCKHFETCGGCALQHLAAQPYRSWKQEQVRLAMAQRGFSDINISGPTDDIKADDVLGDDSGRRKAVLKFTVAGGRPLLGFTGRRSNQIIDIQECAVLAPSLTALIPELRGFLTRLGFVSAEIAVTRCSNGVDLLIRQSGGGTIDLSLEQRELLTDFAETNDIARISMDSNSGQGGISAETIIQRRSPVISVGHEMPNGGIDVAIPAGSFVQATEAGQNALIKFARENLADAFDDKPGGPRKYVDLFSGWGAFAHALAMDRGVAVHAIEGDELLTAACQNAVNRAGGRSTVSTETRDLFRNPLGVKELNAYDGIIFDPPRAGAREQAEYMSDSSVPVIVGISCNPRSFARDARILVDGGYQLEKIEVFDQFRWSAQIELAAVFRRDKAF